MAPSPEQKLIDEQRELIKIQQQLVQKQRSQIIDLKEMINELRGLNNQQLELSENQDKKIDEQKDLMGKLQSLNDKQQELCNQLCERIQQQAAVIEDIGIQCKELIARVASWEMYAEAKGVEIAPCAYCHFRGPVVDQVAECFLCESKEANHFGFEVPEGHPEMDLDVLEKGNCEDKEEEEEGV